MTYNVNTSNQGKLGLRTRRAGISPRTIHRTSGQAVSIDGFIGIDGFPSGIQDRSESNFQKKRFERLRGLRQRIKFLDYPLTISWVIGLSLLGAQLQGWLF